MKNLRDFATPITIGAFVLMATTGILMFFHLDSGLNKLAHEWLGWVMVAGALAHAAANWNAFKRYFLASNLGRALIGLFVAVLVLSFASPPGGRQNGGSPPVLAMRAIANAPLTSVAPLTGRPAARLLEELKAAGIELANENASIASVAGDSRESQGRAMRVLFHAN